MELHICHSIVFHKRAGELFRELCGLLLGYLVFDVLNVGWKSVIMFYITSSYHLCRLPMHRPKKGCYFNPAVGPHGHHWQLRVSSASCLKGTA